MSGALGQPFMPWQQLVADVANEVLPNGLPAFREIIVTVPRQSGKTTWVLSQTCERCTTRSLSQRVAYTAQTGADARKKLLEDQVPLLMGSPLKAAVQQVSKAQGNEGVLFRNGSRLSVLASSVSAGHGKVIDLAQIDEAFDDVDDRREQAMLPAMITRQDAQLIVVSTMGTDASVYLNRKIDIGRQAALEGLTSGIAYFEWAIPEDEDINDPRSWYLGMPALGLTVREDEIAHAHRTMTEGEFRRAFGNQRTSSSERIIPEVTWRAACHGDVGPSGRLKFVVDVSPDRDWTAIASAGGGVVELIDYRPGAGWAVDELERLTRMHGGSVALEKNGPAGSLIIDLENRGIDVETLSGPDVQKACGQFFDEIPDGKVSIRIGPFHRHLESAVLAASKLVSGDVFRWGRRSSVDITPLMVVTIGHMVQSIAPIDVAANVW